MAYYLISDINVDIKVNDLECRITAEHLGCRISEVYSVAERQVEKAEKLIDEIRFITTTKPAYTERILDKFEGVLRDKYNIDTDLIEIEAGYGEPFTAELLKVDDDGTLHMENQCPHCGEWVNGKMHIKTYFSGEKPLCPECDKHYIPCNECLWDENCSVCPFKKHN